jgi:hypothetical protein
VTDRLVHTRTESDFTELLDEERKDVIGFVGPFALDVDRRESHIVSVGPLLQLFSFEFDAVSFALSCGAVDEYVTGCATAGDWFKGGVEFVQFVFAFREVFWTIGFGVWL